MKSQQVRYYLHGDAHEILAGLYYCNLCDHFENRELVTRKNERQESSAVQVMAIITILITVLCLLIVTGITDIGTTPKVPDYNF